MTALEKLDLSIMSKSVYLSKRANHLFRNEDFLIKYFYESEKNPFHPETNPQNGVSFNVAHLFPLVLCIALIRHADEPSHISSESSIVILGPIFSTILQVESNIFGIVNLGTCVNHLMGDELEKRLSRDDVFKFNSEDHQHYFLLYGKPPLASAVAEFFNRYLNPPNRVSPHDVIILNGSTSCLEALGFTLFDPGDVYLTPTPTYGRIFGDLQDRFHVQPCELALREEPDEEGKSFTLTERLLETRILELHQRGKTVRGFVLVNPSNPLGDIYSHHLLTKILEVCAKYEIHVIVDEVYLFASFSPDFQTSASVLSLPGIPDPQRTHVVWSLSKDIGLAGLRTGVIWTQNAAVRKVLQDIAIFYCVPSIIQDTVTTLLTDYRWFEDTFFPTQRERLQRNYSSAVKKLEELGAVVRPSVAGFYVWFNLKHFLREQTAEAELELFDELFKSKLFIVPGAIFYCETPGWFRLIFAVSKVELIQGFKILEGVLKKRLCNGA